MEKAKVTFESFLRVIGSPQFKKNAEEINSFLQRTEEESNLLRIGLGFCANSFVQIYRAYQDLLFMKEAKTKGIVEGKTYKFDDEKLIKQLLDTVETSYLNNISEIEFAFRRIPMNTSLTEEILSDPQESWLEDENADEMSMDEFIKYYFNKNQIKLFLPRLAARLLIKWRDQVILSVPYHDAVALRGRPFTLESIDEQIDQLDLAMDNGNTLLHAYEDDMINQFITSLLDARVKRDNKLYRDVYNVLVLYQRVPKEIIATHDNNEETNPYIRENYIKSKFEKLIAGSADYMMWYKLPQKKPSKSSK